MINWGVIGASTIAQEWMINAINKSLQSRVLAIMSRSQQRGEDVQKQFGIEHLYTELDALLENPELDVIYVGTTNELHKPQTLAVASAKKHVLCEKPLALSIADARQMIDACDRAGVVMGTNHHLRNAVTHRKIRDLVQNGTIGNPIAARVFHAVLLSPNLRTWRTRDSSAGGGVILDVTVHDTDTLRFILNDEVESVMAFHSSHGFGEHGIEDTVMGVMRFDGGTLAQFHDSFVIGHAGTGLEIHGTEGSLIATDVMTQRPVGQVLLRRGNQEQPVKLPPHVNLYECAVNCFNQAVQGAGEPAATADDGLRSLAVALAVKKSAQTGEYARVQYS